MAIKELWVESYRPKTIDGYVFKDARQRTQVETWIKDKSIPHLLLSGSAGVGKTTLAKMLINEVGVEGFDVKEINASRNNGIDEIRDSISRFVSVMPFGPFKVVLLDEADNLSMAAQQALRGVMEQYQNTARFILTCNYPHRLIPAIHSRCQGFHIDTVDKIEFISRVATILVEENVEFDLDALDAYVDISFPDLRKCINLVQQNVHDNKLENIAESGTSSDDWRLQMVELFLSGKIQEARTLLCGKLAAEEMVTVYRWLYDHIDIFGDNAVQDSAVLIIKQALVDHTICADPEINLAATLIKLSRLVS